MSRHSPEPTEPTGDQCERHTLVFEQDGKVGYAIWYPQMGGYVGKAVAVMDKQWWTETSGGTATGGCIDVYVWHDGEFPFSAGRPPICIHHCEPEQFVEFGKALTRLNAKGRNA